MAIANSSLRRWLKDARALSNRAFEAAKTNDQTETAAMILLGAILREAEFGNVVPARHQASTALALVQGQVLQILASLTLARVGYSRRAEEMAKELNKRSPANTLLNTYWLPTIRAAIEVNRNNPERAVELLESTSTYELCAPSAIIGGLYPVYVRAQAYLQEHKGKEAAMEYQKIIEHRGIAFNYPTSVLAHLGLARAYNMSGDTAKARTAYQDFFALWKDADPDIPVLKEAKAEYAKLK